MPNFNDDLTFDYVIVGGGSAGAVIARRLADAGIGTIALIEAGPLDEGVPCLMDVSRLSEQPTSLDWGFLASTTDAKPARLNYSRAKVLGGCGTHNDCAWLIPPESDFAEWERLGAKGWGPQEIRSHINRLLSQVGVETRPDTNPVSAALLRAGQELGLRRTEFRQEISPGIGMLPLNAIGKHRQSSSVSYLHPLSKLPEMLEVFSETFVTRVIIQDGRAIGVETSLGPVHARNEVIITAGSIQSPQLLMVSGIGEAQHLGAMGIPVVADVPGVGRNLADHYSSAVVFELKESVPAWDVTPYESIMLLKVDADAPAPDCLCQFGLRPGNPSGRHGEKSTSSFNSEGRLIDIASNATRPRSRGDIRLVTSDMRDKPRIRLNYLSDPEDYDLRIIGEGMRFARRFIETHSFGEIAVREVAPGPSVVKDDDITDYIRSNLETVYHAAGTCRMGSDDDPTAVVDTALRVRNIASLRVCDASIFPSMVTVNINCAVMTVAEKAAATIIAAAKTPGSRAANEALLAIGS
ncbi:MULTISPECIES: GMC family oxidoreductase [Rhizobium]|uniref:Glucose-methanol-choline oxidoreductase N-terminal domain-containing protein n=1 Tax=Rhizobium leguminosarum TaxID=384 RepID=A0A1B1CLA1_RHILE|nr:GMC family oxidoreductase [Rhizobium leguminosarum]ANP89931.1 hypothetical protein BA011_30090 [Rhizobium leguminosarum]ANP90547.1 hypothetical protein BA011_31995 [Rhizobium leguminosarum]